MCITPGALNDENPNDVIAPGPEPSNPGAPVDINAFHAAHAHVHEGALRKTAKQIPGKHHPQEGAARVQGLLNGKGHQDANSLVHTRSSSLRPGWKGRSVTAEGIESQADLVVTLNRGMTSLGQVTRGSR